MIRAKAIFRLFTGIILFVLSGATAQAQQIVDLSVQNQRISGDSLFFDLYLKKAGISDIYLGNCDFILTYDSANFSSATRSFLFVPHSTLFKDYSGALVSDSYQINTSFGSRNNPGNLKISVSRYANDLTDVAKIDTSSTNRLGTFVITGMEDVSRFTNIKWVTENDWGTYTRIFSMAPTYPYAASQTSLGSTAEPDPVTAPLVNSSNISFRNITTNSFTLKIGNKGDGAKRLIVAKAGSPIGSDSIANAVAYTANAAFGSGDEIGNSGVFVVYNGSGDSVDISNLDDNTRYYFAVYEYNGDGGITESYLTPGTYANEITKAGYITVNVKVFLQGPYSGGSMSTSLNSLGYLPKKQPYNTSPWNYSGNDSVTAIPNSDIVDWVLVELLDTTNGTAREKRACFIKKDGKIVDLDGVSSVHFNSSVSGNYYVVIRHRNHLAIMSSGKVSLGLNSLLYDFTTGTSKFYGNQASLLNNTYGMFAGDENKSGIISSADYVNITNDRNKSGYLQSDINLSGVTSAADYVPVTNNRNKSTLVP